MTELILIDPDERWFKDHPSRQTHIRDAIRDECHAEFMSLGDHDKDRRRIICWKIPGNWKMPYGYKGSIGKILKIPFLPYGTETIEDEDATLIPIINEVFVASARKYGIPVPKARL